MPDMPDMPDWAGRLAELLDPDPDRPGAELAVDDPDGTEVFRTALARMWRTEPDYPDVIWIRPVFGSYQEDDGGAWRFSLAATRRRSLTFTTVDVEDDGLVFDLVNGQRAHVRPVRPDLQLELERWDTFLLTQLSAQDEAALEELSEDSWQGRWE